MQHKKFWDDGPNDYSTLFLEHCLESDLKFPNDSRIPHPFYYVEIAIDAFNGIEAHEVAGIWAFPQTYALMAKVKEKESEALRWFQLEYSAVYLRKKNKYLNNVVDALRHLHGSVQKNVRDEANKYEEKKNVSFQNHQNPLPTILELSIRHNFHAIFSLHQAELNQTNWKYLSKYFSIKEPLLSFRRVHKIEDTDFEYHFKTGLINTGILDPNTEFRVFKDLFLEKPVKKKIEWRESLPGLAYFITSIKDKGIIEDPRNKHWSITSEFFTHKGNPVPNLKRQKLTRQDLLTQIDKFVDNIYSNFKK